MEKIAVEIKATTNTRKILRQLPDVRLLERLAKMQSDGTTILLATWLAECREELHVGAETPSAALNTERILGATAMLSDLIGILSDSRTLLDISKKLPPK